VLNVRSLKRRPLQTIFIRCGKVANTTKNSSRSLWRKAFQYVRRPGPEIIVWILIVFTSFPILMALIFGSGISDQLVIFLISVTALVLVCEAFFRIAYRVYVGRPYLFLPKIPFDKLIFESHPYISYVYKRNILSRKRASANYPLHRGRFFYGEYTTNSQRFLNGPDGQRDIIIPKPDGLFRVNCLGASTTGNYIESEGKAFSYPMELENILNSSLDIPLEVNNCGVGGYNSADILILFALQIVDTQPDVVVIYHAYNDIRAYMTPEFEPDYFHYRRNLGESNWKLALGEKIPNAPLKFFNFLTHRWLYDNSNSVLDHLSKGAVDLALDPSVGLRAYKRNLQHIIDLCRGNDIQVVLSTYCHFLYDKIKDESLHRLYAGIVKRENEIVRHLADKNELMLVDNALLVPDDERYFVDSVHFTPEGMSMIAKNIADAVQKLDLTAR
jgi:lysophospholipase L1-like esterase